MVNSRRASTRFVPASTFKITNSLIALETGVVKDENEIIPFGGQPQQVTQWARDMSMREAISLSNVPVYQARHQVTISGTRPYLTIFSAISMVTGGDGGIRTLDTP